MIHQLRDTRYRESGSNLDAIILYKLTTISMQIVCSQWYMTHQRRLLYPKSLRLWRIISEARSWINEEVTNTVTPLLLLKLVRLRNIRVAPITLCVLCQMEMRLIKIESKNEQNKD
jgi:hypothetical protein